MLLQNNKILRNFSVLTGTNILIQILSILSSIRLARLLHPEGYGYFNLVFVQASIFSIVGAYGLRLVIIRHIARNNGDANKIFIASNQIRAIFTSIAILIAVIYNTIVSRADLSLYFLLAVAITITFQTFWDTIESIAFGFEKMTISGIINLAFTGIWIIQVYSIPSAIFTPILLVYIFIINQILKTIIYYFWLNKNILKKNNTNQIKNIEDHKNLLAQSNFYFILALFTALQNQIPVLLLQFNSTIDQIGLFNLGNRILSPLQMMLNTLLTALFPMLARLALVDAIKFGDRVRTLLNIIVIVGIWASLCFAIFSRDVVNLLYGNDYSTSAKVILTQCWYTLMFAIFCTIGTVLSAFDKQKLLSKLSVVYGLISLPIFYFGSKFGAIGLSVAFVSAAFLNMSYHWIIFRKTLNNSISIRYSLIIFSSIGILAFATFNFEFNIGIFWKLIVMILISLPVFSYLYKVEYTKLKV